MPHERTFLVSVRTNGTSTKSIDLVEKIIYTSVAAQCQTYRTFSGDVHRVDAAKDKTMEALKGSLVKLSDEDVKN